MTRKLCFTMLSTALSFTLSGLSVLAADTSVQQQPAPAQAQKLSPSQESVTPYEHQIGRQELKSKLDKHQVVLVDALGPKYFLRAHIPGSLMIPFEDVDTKGFAQKLLPNKNAEIIVYCMSHT
jgi:3-mercaptopyruvate sulfurtransferase SseA